MRVRPRRLARSLAALLATLVLVSMAACSSAATAPPSIPADAIKLSARDLAFSTDKLVVPAGKPFTISLDILESASHNVAIYTDDSFSNLVYKEDARNGPGTFLFNVPALAAGTYAFRCEIHTNMKGTLTAG
jgi:plastocyanin